MTKLIINNKEHHIELKGHETLLEVLRDTLSLTGTKTGCDESECGTCMVNINGKAILSCVTLAASLENSSIETIEGLAESDETLHPIQQSFIDHGAVQCGFCIPGIIMAAKPLLEENPNPSREDIDYALDGNLCRCAGYHKIIAAIQDAGQRMLKKDSQPTHV